MEDLLSKVQFAKPLFFWLFLALPLLWFRFRDRHLLIIILRTVVAVLLILCLTEPQSVKLQGKQKERIFAFDLSQSIPASMRRWMVEVMQGNFAPHHRDQVFVFAGQTKEDANWGEWLKGERTQQNALQSEKTNLENLLTTILALPATPHALVLFTDGWENQGSAERLLPSIAGRGLKIYPILPAEPKPFTNVAVTKVLAPTYGNSGEAANLKVVLENQNDHEVEGTLLLERNSQKFRTEEVRLKPGSQIFTFQVTLPQESLVSYRAGFTARQAKFDSYAADNQALVWVTVKTKAKVLLLNGQSGGGRYLEEILKRQGFEVMARTAESPPNPTGYAVVIFNNIEGDKISPAYLSAVERHVADGNGFLMLGGEASFGPGSFRRTPIENLLPVEPKEPKREVKNRAVVLVIDKSGSMREENRLLYAQEAAKAVARQLKDDDLLGVVGFDVSPFVVVPVGPVGKVRNIYDAQIDRLKPGGQTYFHPALIEAKRQLERQSAAIKHIIVLSDGETRGSHGELVDLVGVMKNEMKITISAVAIGTEADIRVMKRISQYGGGLFHHTLDPATLPQIVLQQLQERPREESQGERDLTPTQNRSSELLAALTPRSYPSVQGYMETELKRGAQLDLMIPREERRAPLLASWRYRRGKVAAFTTDLDSRWTRSWIQWNGLQGFWQAVLEWLRTAEEAVPLHEARISLTGTHPVIDLMIYEEASADSQYRFSLSNSNVKADGMLKRLASGHYQAGLPITVPGDYVIQLTEERHGHRLSLPAVRYTLPYNLSTELPRSRFNVSLLDRLARATGGEINPQLETLDHPSSTTKELKSLHQPFILLALVIFMLEVAVRKLYFLESD